MDFGTGGNTAGGKTRGYRKGGEFFMKKEEYSKIFIILCAINITCLLISNIITIKTINIWGLIFTAGDILFPFTYILNDVFTEVYGFDKSKLIIWTSFFCNLLMIIIFKITILCKI